MSNLLKMYLFRMKRSKMTYLLPMIALAFCLMIELISYFGMRAFDNVTVNLPGVTTDQGIAHVDILNMILTFVAYMIVPAICVIFSMAFINADMSSGFAKNLVGYTGNKVRQTVAEMVVPAIFTLGIILLSTLVTGGLAFALFPKPEINGVGKFFLVIFTMFLEILAFQMILKWLADATGKYILFLILGAVYAGYSAVIYELINVLVNLKRDIPDFSVGKYTLLGGMVANNTNSDPKDIALSIGIAGVVLILFFVLDLQAMKKREIK